MVAWISKVQEGDFLGGITAMNDMLEMYPHDKHLLYLAGNWLMGENGNDQAQRMMEKALAIDKNFPAALNDLAYVDARNRKFDKAFAAMDRYVALLPKEPNPQDSYGELLRMAGNFEGSLTHYRAALKIDPDFVTSQLGLGDTYALMGNQEQARAEYDKAIRFAHNEADRLTYSMQKAMTYVRDGNYAEADKEYCRDRRNRPCQRTGLQEAQAYRHLAEYQTDDNVALKHLKLAEEALHHQATISASDRDEEMSRILRNRAVRAARAGNQPLADKSLHQLEALANGSRNRVIQSSYHGAAGTLLMDQKKYRRSHRPSGRGSGQSLHPGVAGAGLLQDRSRPISCTRWKPGSAAPTCLPWSRPWSSPQPAPGVPTCSGQPPRLSRQSSAAQGIPRVRILRATWASSNLTRWCTVGGHFALHEG